MLDDKGLMMDFYPHNSKIQPPPSHMATTYDKKISGEQILYSSTL